MKISALGFLTTLFLVMFVAWAVCLTALPLWLVIKMAEHL